MLHTYAANIRCDRYCSTFWDFGVELNTRLYMEFTVSSPLFLMRKNLSCPTCMLRFATLATKLFHSTNLIPTKALLKETFRGIAPRVFAK